MPTPIIMPQLGESVTEGTVVRWLKAEGEHVERDEPLLELSTDKVNADLPSPVSGTLVRRSVAEGAVVPIGGEVAQIEEADGVSVSAAEPSPASTAAEQPSVPPAAAPQPMIAGTPETHGEGSERRRYSPLVRKLGAEHGIDLERIEGTGLGGRVTKDDVLAYVARSRSAQTGPAVGKQERVTRESVLAYVDGGRAHEPPTAPSAVDGATGREAAAPMSGTAQPSVTARDGDEERVPLTTMRRGIAEHMVRSKQVSPHATTVTEVDMSRIVRWRERHRAAIKARDGVDLTYVAFVVQAAVAALKAFPYLNASWGGDAIVLKKQINIGIAVGMDDGLLVPVIHRADERSLLGLARAVADLAERARNRKLALGDLQGGTFTVNNTGVFGSIVSTPVINQPQAAILSMEAIVKRPVVVDDAIAIRSMMNLCLSFDHRIVDGLMAGRFTQHVRNGLEQFVLPDAP